MRGIVPFHAALCSLIFLGGCASLRGGRGVPPMAPAPAEAPAAGADSTGLTIAVFPPESTIVTPSPVRIPSRGSSSPRTPREEPPMPETGAPGDTLPPPTISVRLTGDERARLFTETERDLAEARAAVGQIDATTLNETQRERVATLRDLIDSAMEAREKEDLPAAAQLARKARLLAEELASH